jgi:hypothetical protein
MNEVYQARSVSSVGMPGSWAARQSETATVVSTKPTATAKPSGNRRWVREVKGERSTAASLSGAEAEAMLMLLIPLELRDRWAVPEKLVSKLCAALSSLV